MAVIALHSAATGLSSLSTNIDVIANNLANVNTSGFKAFRVNFEDLAYDEKRQPGVENANGDRTPAGLHVGLGTRISNTQIDFDQGSPVDTGRDGDLMVDGRGFFQVTTENGTRYTRAGNFFVNSEGDLVLGNSAGPRVEPGINIPENATSFEVDADGTVNVFTNDSPDPSVVGQILLSNFINPHGLRAEGGNLYAESAASGPPIEGVPGEQNFGTILQRFQESSNVDPVRELIDLIKTQRAFEMNSQSIQAADEALQVIGNLRRF